MFGKLLGVEGDITPEYISVCDWTDRCDPYKQLERATFKCWYDASGNLVCSFDYCGC